MSWIFVLAAGLGKGLVNGKDRNFNISQPGYNDQYIKTKND
jgi:hypothetical protein